MNQAGGRLPSPGNEEVMQRFRQVGDLVLDLFHRDGRVDDGWLGLRPREFELLWRLAQDVGTIVTRRQLLEEVWRLSFEPETNSLAVHVTRVRQKMECFGLGHILKTHPDGGYFLDVPVDAEGFGFTHPS